MVFLSDIKHHSSSLGGQLGDKNRLNSLLDTESIVATVREPLLLLDSNMKILLANESFYKAFQVKPEETEGKILYDLGNRQWDIPKLRELLEDILPNTSVFNDFEVSHNFQHIGEKVMLLNARQLRTRPDAQPMILLAIEDITERKKVENALIESEQRWATTLSSIGDAVIATSKDGNVTFMNPVAQELTGWTLREANGKPARQVFNIVNEYTRQIVDDPVAKVLEKGTAVGLANHTILIRRDGTEICIDDSGAPIRDKDGKITGIILIFRDITEKRKLEAKNEEYSKHLEELVTKQARQLIDSERLSAIGQTAGMIGHDLRNPLQSVEGALYLIKEDLNSLPSDSPLRQSISEMLDSIGSQIAYMNKVVADLQDFVRPMKPQLEEVDVQKVIDGALAIVSIPSDIKVEKAVEEGKVTLDPTLILRVLSNLITNAAQAMPKGGKLTIRTQKNKDEVSISVSDTGVGIPENVKPKLFTPLYTTKSKGQ